MIDVGPGNHRVACLLYQDESGETAPDIGEAA
jgi:hypothetical protein